MLAAVNTLSVFVPVIGTLIVAAAGWIIVNEQTQRREQRAKRREISVGFLIDAYRRIEHISARRITPEVARTLERAVADIQLFGSLDQVRLARQLVEEFGPNPQGSMQLPAITLLLEDLRRDLRSELDLQAVDDEPHSWRIHSPWDQGAELEASSQRQIVVDALIEAHRVLRTATDGRVPHEADDVVRVLADLELFGSMEQVQLAVYLRNVLRDQGKLDDAACLVLMDDIRDELQEDLSLDMRGRGRAPKSIEGSLAEGWFHRARVTERGVRVDRPSDANPDRDHIAEAAIALADRLLSKHEEQAARAMYSKATRSGDIVTRAVANWKLARLLSRVRLS